MGTVSANITTTTTIASGHWVGEQVICIYKMEIHQRRKEATIPQDAPPSYDETIKASSLRVQASPSDEYKYRNEVHYPPEYNDTVHNRVQLVHVPPTNLGCRAAQLVCPHCKHTITTQTTSSPSVLAWGLSAILCFTMLWPCFCVPFCVDSLQSVKHKCPQCKTVLGKYKGCGYD